MQMAHTIRKIWDLCTNMNVESWTCIENNQEANTMARQGVDLDSIITHQSSSWIMYRLLGWQARRWKEYISILFCNSIEHIYLVRYSFVLLLLI